MLGVGHKIEDAAIAVASGKRAVEDADALFKHRNARG
jgi:hypothetical protein